MAAKFVDFGRLFYSGVVFPQNEHGIGIFRKLGQERQRCSALVGEGRGTAGGIKRYTYDLLCRTRRAGGESFAYRRFQYFDIIEGMLTVTVGGRIAIFTLFPTRIVFNRRGYLPARRGIDDNSPRRVATVVESYDVFVHGCSFLAKGLIEHIINLVEP